LFFEDVENLKNESAKTIKRRLSKWQDKFSNWTLVNYAHQYSWSKNVVLSLPSLLFSFKTVSGKTKIYLWDEVVNYLPTNIKYEIINKFCGGNVYEILVPNDSYSIVLEIAKCLETARLNNPFNSPHLLLGVINQNLNELEIEIKHKKDKALSNDISKQRMNVLGKEFQLCKN